MKPIDNRALIREIEDDIEQGTYEQNLPRFQKRKVSMRQKNPDTCYGSTIDYKLLDESKTVSLIYRLQGGAKGFLLKIFRRLVAPIMLPAFQQQNIYNENVAYTFELLDDEIRELKKTVANQQKIIEELQEKL